MRTTIALLAAALTLTATPAEASWVRDCRVSANWPNQTSMVLDINPGVADAADISFGYSQRNRWMAAYNGTVYFQADNGQVGAELWRIRNGAPEMVEDLAPGAAGSAPHAFAIFQNRLHFAATTPANGEELFRSDGSSIALAAEMAPGAEGGEIAALAVYQNALYFLRSDQDGPQVWRYDGATAQPVDAINAIPGSLEGNTAIDHTFVVFKGRLYFVKQTALPEHYQLWAYDGTNVTKIKALTPPENLTTYPFNLGVHQDALYFGVVAGLALQAHDELWKYMGQGAPVKMATLGNASTGSQPGSFQTYKGKLYFNAGSEFYRLDGANVQPLGAGPGGPPLFAGNMSLYSAADRIYMAGSYDGDDSPGREPYTFDGTSTDILRNIMPDDASSYPGSYPTSAVEVGTALYFYADDGAHGRELWRVNGRGIGLLKCDIVVAPLWDDWREWIVDRREVIVSTWLVGPDARARLLSREAVTAVRGTDIRVHVLDADARDRALSGGFALATVVYDRQTGTVVDRGYDVVGTPAPRLREQLAGFASELDQRALRDVMAERITGY